MCQICRKISDCAVYLKKPPHIGCNIPDAAAFTFFIVLSTAVTKMQQLSFKKILLATITLRSQYTDFLHPGTVIEYIDSPPFYVFAHTIYTIFIFIFCIKVLY